LASGFQKYILLPAILSKATSYFIFTYKKVNSSKFVAAAFVDFFVGQKNFSFVSEEKNLIFVSETLIINTVSTISSFV